MGTPQKQEWKITINDMLWKALEVHFEKDKIKAITREQIWYKPAFDISKRLNEEDRNPVI